ncbi:hypothetical protein CB1_001410006 [Camelus ferus]|nr:hypothetical protein CB1_001410006 [Camelus ferus]
MDSRGLTRRLWSLCTFWSTNHTLTYLMGPVDSTGTAMLMEAEEGAWKSTSQTPEVTLLEINQELHLELTKQKQEYRDLTQKFLVCQATTYYLANQLQKYKCEECKDIIESVLGEKLQFRVVTLTEQLAEKLAEKPVLADERFREYDSLIRSQARELTELRRKLRDRREDSVLLIQQLKVILTHDDLDNNQGQGFQEQLTKGRRLAERLARKLSPEVDEDEEYKLDEETLTPSIELQELEKEEVLQDCQDECVLNPSVLQEGSVCNQLDSEGKVALGEEKVGRAPDVAGDCSDVPEGEIPTDLPDNENDRDEAAGQEPTTPSTDLQEFEKDEVLHKSQDEGVLVPSLHQEGSDVYETHSDGKFAFHEEKLMSALEGAGGVSHVKEDEIPSDLPENQNNQDDVKGAQPIVHRLSKELSQMVECDIPRHSVEESYLTYSALPDLSDSFWPYRSAAIYSFEGLELSYARDVTSDSWEDRPQGPLNFQGSEMQASQAQLQTSSQVIHHLQLQRDQRFNCGDGNARRGLSSTVWGFTANTEFGDQWLPLQELGLDASIGMKNPPKVEDCHPLVLCTAQPFPGNSPVIRAVVHQVSGMLSATVKTKTETKAASWRISDITALTPTIYSQGRTMALLQDVWFLGPPFTASRIPKTQGLARSRVGSSVRCPTGLWTFPPSGRLRDSAAGWKASKSGPFGKPFTAGHPSSASRVPKTEGAARSLVGSSVRFPGTPSSPRSFYARDV